MILLQDIIKKLKQDLSNQDELYFSRLADEAIKQATEITRNEKTMRSGELEFLTNDLAELINLFPNNIPLDDLRYHLAHLYMRSQKWQEAENQLLGIKDYCHNEAQIYAALCAFKQKNQADNDIKAEIKGIAEKLRDSKKLLKTMSIQEQHYNLLEMLVYAGGIEYSVLEPYYKKGLTRFDLNFRYKVKYFDLNVSKVDSNFSLSNCSRISRFRLLHLLQFCKEKKFLVIFDPTQTNQGRQLECYKSNLREPLQVMATKLAREFPHSVPIFNLIDELKDYLGESRHVINISTWKRELCNFIRSDLSGKDDAIITEHSQERENSKYKLNYSFILVKPKKGKNE